MHFCLSWLHRRQWRNRQFLTFRQAIPWTRGRRMPSSTSCLKPPDRMPARGRFLYNPRLVVGGPHDTEFGVNFPTYHTGGGNSFCSSANPTATCAYVEPNIKWKFYKNDDQGLSFVSGALLHQPLNGRNEVAGVQLNETWGLFYGNFTKKVKTGDYGPRFSAGPYVVADSGKANFGSCRSSRRSDPWI